MARSAICVPSFQGLILWSGNNCAQWSVRTSAEKLTWIENYFRTHGVVVNEAAMQPIARQMDTYCGALAPAGAADDVVATWRDSNGEEHTLTQGMVDRLNNEHGMNFNPNDPNWNTILTSPAFAQLIQNTFATVGTTVVGVVNSANKTNYPNYGSGGGYGSGLGNFGGAWGGFNSNYGAGSGYVSWTPIIIGGALVLALGIGLIVMSQKSNSKGSK